MQGMPDSWWVPRFSAARVIALMTSREGGCSAAPFDSLNLRDGLGDEPACVHANRARVHAALGMRSVMLNQVHGAQVVSLSRALLEAAPPVADASLSQVDGVACEVQVADCLPVLFADVHGRAVAAAHAGWRGLAAGVLEATVRRLCALVPMQPGGIEAWLGPCIGPAAFQVGPDVLRAFGAAPQEPGPMFRPQARDKWLADLPGLARQRLAQAGVQRVSGNDSSLPWCTVAHPARCYSFRRDGTTGRMAACIGLRGV